MTNRDLAIILSIFLGTICWIFTIELGGIVFYALAIYKIGEE